MVWVGRYPVDWEEVGTMSGPLYCHGCGTKCAVCAVIALGIEGPDGEFVIEMGVDEDDAPLIAGAPELLEACRVAFDAMDDAVEFLADHPRAGGPHEAIEHALRVVSAAIFKATRQRVEGDDA